MIIDEMQIPTQGPTLIEQSYNFLLESICSGSLLPGERLQQESLSAKMNVSRQPVAQALSILRTQGFVRDEQDPSRSLGADAAYLEAILWA